jgi:hypothetical protein
MRHYKVYLVSGRVLTIEAKSFAVLPPGTPGGHRIVFHGLKGQVVAEAWAEHILGYGEYTSITGEEK